MKILDPDCYNINTHLVSDLLECYLGLPSHCCSSQVDHTAAVSTNRHMTHT